MKQKFQITALILFCLAGYNSAKANCSLSDTLEIEQVVVTANKTLVNKNNIPLSVSVITVNRLYYRYCHNEFPDYLLHRKASLGSAYRMEEQEQ